MRDLVTAYTPIDTLNSHRSPRSPFKQLVSRNDREVVHKRAVNRPFSRRSWRLWHTQTTIVYATSNGEAAQLLPYYFFFPFSTIQTIGVTLETHPTMRKGSDFNSERHVHCPRKEFPCTLSPEGRTFSRHSTRCRGLRDDFDKGTGTSTQRERREGVSLL